MSQTPGLAESGQTRDEWRKQHAAEIDLADWAEQNGRRDDLVRQAIRLGVSKHRIHVITGIARTTIDRIAANG
jgi:hypothetical protein